MMELLTWSMSIAGLLGAIAAFVRYVVRPSRAWLKKMRQFFTDWFGEEERPGIHDRRPGVMEQLSDHSKRLGNIERHVGNGDPTPLRHRLESHLEWSGELERKLNRVTRHVGLSEE